MPGTIAGWGNTSQGGSPSPNLMKAEVDVMDPMVCKHAYGAFNADNMLCAGYETGGVDVCRGDAGEPLIIEGTLAGIVSWTDSCGQAR
ncbi:trypsin-like serine protease [Streptomyces sp. NBC_01007]|nr:trypsin-like serine protease [Streptomyces sp. NBC_01007]